MFSMQSARVLVHVYLCMVSLRIGLLRKAVYFVAGGFVIWGGNKIALSSFMGVAIIGFIFVCKFTSQRSLGKTA
jgi:hypothetical protein